MKSPPGSLHYFEEPLSSIAGLMFSDVRRGRVQAPMLQKGFASRNMEQQSVGVGV